MIQLDYFQVLRSCQGSVLLSAHRRRDGVQHAIYDRHAIAASLHPRADHGAPCMAAVAVVTARGSSACSTEQSKPLNRDACFERFSSAAIRQVKPERLCHGTFRQNIFRTAFGDTNIPALGRRAGSPGSSLVWRPRDPRR